jgi:hypothetical protein
VLQLDQAIDARPSMPTSLFSLTSELTHQSMPISEASYSARAHTIRLVIAPRALVHGPSVLNVSPAGIANLLGQTLDGQQTGIPGTNFVATIGL